MGTRPPPEGHELGLPLEVRDLEGRQQIGGGVKVLERLLQLAAEAQQNAASRAPWTTPPGWIATGWVVLPATASHRRFAMPLRRSARCRTSGSTVARGMALSRPRKSGAARKKRWSTWLWMVSPCLARRRRRAACSDTFKPKARSVARTVVRQWEMEQIPQILAARIPAVE